MTIWRALPMLALAAAGCAPADHPMGNDALPSAQVIAFQKADTRLGWRGAHVEWDERTCAVYRGFAPDGVERQEPLLDEGGRPICAKP